MLKNIDFESLKKYKIIVLLILIYILGVLIFFLAGSFDKNIVFIPDERLYIQAAKAIANGDGLSYNGIKGTFQKVFYSLVISPSFLVTDLHTQTKLICLFGVLFEMTSIFPIYLISRKLDLDRLKGILICVASLSFPNFLFSMTFMSETAFLPLWLWVIYFVLLLLDSNDIRIYIPIILGVLAYVLYMCKEVGIVAIPALFIVKGISIIRKKESVKGLVPCVIAIVSFTILFCIGKFLLFDGASSYYSYEITVPKAPESSEKTPLYFVMYASLFYLGYIILVNNIFPLFIRSKRDSLNYKFSLYIEIAILMLVFIVVYKISLKQDYGLLSPRLHLRYFEPLFIPYIISFIARLSNEEGEGLVENKYVKLAFWVYLVALMILPGLGMDELLDSTTSVVYSVPEKIAYALFLGSPRKTVLLNVLMKFIVLLIVLIGLKLFKSNRKKFFVYFISVVLLINLSGTFIKYNDFRSSYYLPGNYVDEMQYINNKTNELSGDILMIIRVDTRAADIAITYYSINNTDVYLAENEFEVNDKKITLNAGDATRDVNIDDYDYIVYDNNIWEDDERESIPSDKVVLSTDNFFIYDNK